MSKRRIKTTLKRSVKLSSRDIIMLFIGGALVFLAFKAINMLDFTSPPLSSQKTGSIDITHLPAEVQQWKEPLVQISHKYNIDARFVAIIMTIESKGSPDAVSEVGAQGLMQVMPYTAKDIATKHLKQPINDYDLKEPHTNIEFGVAYLSYLRDQFGGSHTEDTVRLVAAGYNGGPGAAIRLQKGQTLNPETTHYTKAVAKLWQEQD